MCELSRWEGENATKLTATNGGGSRTNGSTGLITPNNGSDDPLWFAKVARGLLPSDAGFALHTLTDVPESTCYRYARGETQISAFIYRKLLWRDDGWPWLNGMMDGCKAAWWIKHQDAEKLYNALSKELVSVELRASGTD